MKQLTISEISEKLKDLKDNKDPFLGELKSDGRKGVQQLLARWGRQRAEEARLYGRYQEMTVYERRLKKSGWMMIAGTDEAGRGPLAGPVIAAAVILPEGFYLPGLDDSKKLSEAKRDEFYNEIMAGAAAVGVGRIGAEEIDRINILQASKKAMLLALADMGSTPDYLLTDAVDLDVPYPAEAVIKGDSKSVTIAAASVIAKVTRDRYMRELDELYPHYGFGRNMGYGTRHHLEAIEKHGIINEHRKSFAPIKGMY
ncbi:ribonuclease HII [Bacillus infantis]|uniref:ribonuclease HII n=1 Tax=Bacillus infantis TaxID=324767 RepID=UPI001CD22048|nr:ribonuclease HII [Bacillus infantis]MCA1040756.1 ribonuclease HII [Bacillus infantis]